MLRADGPNVIIKKLHFQNIKHIYCKLAILVFSVQRFDVIFLFLVTQALDERGRERDRHKKERERE